MNTEVNIFASCKSPKVESTLNIVEVLQKIQNGGPNLKLILEARTAFSEAHKKGKDCPHYDKIKANYLKTFTPNATFNKKRNNKNIKHLSGLVYLDIDGSTQIDFKNPYIFATWLSLSETGRGVLIKTEGVTTENFPLIYDKIVKEMGLNVDLHCKDLSRQVVISYDPDIYINYSSKSYDCKDIVLKKERKIPPTVPKKKEGKVCDLMGDKLFKGVRWDNIEDYDLKGKEYVVFDEPYYFSKAYIPQTISQGKRNSTIKALIYQIKALNPELTDLKLFSIINVINSRCTPALPATEIEGIKRELKKKLEYEDFTPILNYPRSVIFADSVDKKDRQIIGAQVAGKNKVKKTLDKIQECLDDWDINIGKITNKKIAENIGMAKKTIDKYSPYFRQQKKIINEACII